jgi:hypothetical protein
MDLKPGFREAARTLILRDEGQHCDWFTAMLLELMGKADQSNLQRIARGFPDEVDAYIEWQRSLSSEEFRKKYQEHVF